MKYVFFILLIKLSICEWSWGWCKDKADISDVSNLNITDFAGTWYLILRTRDDKTTSDCMTYIFTPTSEGNMNVEIKVSNENSRTTIWRKNEVPTHFKEEIEPFLSRIYDREYNIINTDYKSYSILYSCYNAGLAKDEYAWVLSRNPNMETNVMNNMTNYIYDKFEIQRDEMITVDQNSTLCKR